MSQSQLGNALKIVPRVMTSGADVVNQVSSIENMSLILSSGAINANRVMSPMNVASGALVPSVNSD